MRAAVLLTALALALTAASCRGGAAPPLAATTDGAIALANLDHQLAQPLDDAAAVELLLARARLLGDYDALDRAAALAEPHAATAGELVRRARTRAAVHRFADALADLDAAARAGAAADTVAAARVPILVAIGRAGEVLAPLEAAASRRRDFGSLAALAGAYAAVGRFADADRRYAAALAALDTTSPFPYAWTYFARGQMWSEQAGDPTRGEAMYRRALAYLPQLASANLHLAELEAARGDLAAAIPRLERVVASAAEPEAIALLGELHVRTGAAACGAHELARAHRRYDALLARYPLAFADHAAAFFLGPGADPDRAWQLARRNLANRDTDRAVALAVAAAHAAGRDDDLCATLRGSRTPRARDALRACMPR